MANVGDNYTLYTYPITIYYSSDRAATRNKNLSGYTVETFETRIVEKAWTDAAGNWYYPNQGAGTIEMYAITDSTKSYTIGWIRSDDNYGLSSIPSLPTSLNPTLTSFDFTISKLVSTSTYSIEFKIGNVVIATKTGSDTAFKWTFTAAERNLIYSTMYNATASRMDIKISTLIGSSNIGSRSYYTVVNIPESVKPAFLSTPTATIVNPIGGKAYQDISSIKVAGSGIAGSGARLNSTIIRVENATVNGTSYTSQILKNPGNVVVSVTLTDSRSRTETWSTTIPVTAYVNPGVTLFNVNRGSTATQLVISANGSFDNNITTVVPKYNIHYKLKTATAYTSLASGNVIRSAEGKWTLAYAGGSFPTTDVYDIRLTITDNQGRIVYSYGSLSTEAVPMSSGKKGIGIGMMFDESKPYNLQVAGGGISSAGIIDGQGGYTSQAIPQNADLNDYLQAGWYHTHSNAHAATMSNVPSAQSFSLFVTKHAGTAQYFQEYGINADGSNSRLFRRNYYTAWSAWVEIPTMDDIPQVDRTNYVFGNTTLVRYASTRTQTVTAVASPNTTNVTNRWGSWNITFPYAFALPPNVVATLGVKMASRPMADIVFATYNITNTGFGFEIVSLAAATPPLSNWEFTITYTATGAY